LEDAEKIRILIFQSIYLEDCFLYRCVRIWSHLLRRVSHRVQMIIGKCP
jgi:hypothetical protein